MSGPAGGPVPTDAMARELGEGPAAVGGTLAACRRMGPSLAAAMSTADRIVLVGTGGSLAMIRAALPLWRRRIEATPRPPTADAGPAIVARQSAEAVLGDLDGLAWRSTDVVIAVSQSGTSPETLVAARQARNAGATVIAVTAHPESPLASGVAHLLTLASGVETDASTKSALATLAGLLAIGGVLSTDPEAVDACVGRLEAIVADRPWAAATAMALAGSARVWHVGFGAGLGLAEAGALLWHEKVVRPAVAATPSEFRHGLIEAVGPGDAVLLIDVDDPDPRRAAYLARLRGELVALHVDCVAIGPDDPAGGTGPADLADGGRSSGAGGRMLEALLRLQVLAHATARAATTYRDGFRILRHVVEPALELIDRAAD